MYDQIREDHLYIMLYAVVTTMAMMACCYLLFRRANAIAPDITSSARLRRWAGVFFASIALNHVWYMPIAFLSASEDIVMTDLIGGLLDFMTVFPLAIAVLFVMLQDRRRPLWPVAVMMAPIYINGLRIQHFVNLYRKSAANHQPITAQKLAYQSGFRSYNTFSVAFKKRMGMTATEWMRFTE